MKLGERDGLAQTEAMARRTPWPVGLALALLACGAEDSTPPASDGVELPAEGLEDTALAERYVQGGQELPSRATVVALTDRLGMAAEKVEQVGERSRLRLTAAQLRERLWRYDGLDSDAREAMALYTQVADGAGDVVARCRAMARRAQLHGELAADAARSYRELYLALEAFTELPDDTPDAARTEVESCTRDMRARLERARAFRPTGPAWQALQRKGAHLARTAALPVPSATASTNTAPWGPPIGADEQVVVVPDAKLVKGPAKLEAVQPYNDTDGARLVLKLDQAARYSTGMLAPDPKSGRGHRLYLDIEKTKRGKGVGRTIDVGGGLIQRVRLGKREGGTRVVVDLAAAANRRVFYLPNPFRVVIDLARPRAAAPATPTPSSPTPMASVRRITLDPGHGGWDAGAVGPTGLREKDVALDIAHRAAPVIAGELGIETMLTRDTDVFVELEERTARANAFQSDLFVSIHCNATENGEASGYEVFILDPSREADRRALNAVARENHAHRKAPRAMDVRLLDAQITNIAAGLGMGAQTRGSRALAEFLRQATKSSLDTRYPGIEDHGTKTAGFYVLVGAAMPAVLYETSFISNPGDESKLGTADYRQKLADAIVNAVRAYTRK